MIRSDSCIGCPDLIQLAKDHWVCDTLSSSSKKFATPIKARSNIVSVPKLGATGCGLYAIVVESELFSRDSAGT